MARTRDLRTDITADAGGFDKAVGQVNRDLAGLRAGVAAASGDIEISAKVEMGRINRDLATLAASLNKLEEQKISPDLDIPLTDILREEEKVRRMIEKLEKRKIELDVDVDTDKDGGTVGLGTRLEGLLASIPKVGGAFKMLGAGGPYAAAGVAAVGAAVGAVAVPMAGLAAGAAAGAVALNAFSSQAARGERVATVFGSQAAAVDKWADSINEALGLSKEAVKFGAAGIADLLVPQGFTRAKATEITKSVYERGAALAQFSGVDVQQGIDAVSSALLGEREQLKSLGVSISQAQVDARVEVMKTQSAYKGFNDEQLATAATLELIKEKGTDAWAAFQDGPNDALAIVNDWKAGFGDLRTAATEVFGQIAVDIAKAFGAGGGGENPLKKLADWLLENREQITTTVMDIGVALFGALEAGAAFASGMADAFALVMRVSTASVQGLLELVEQFLRGLANVADFLPGLDGVAEKADAAADRIAGWQSTIDTIPRGLGKVSDGLDALKGKAAEFGGKLDAAARDRKTRVDIVADTSAAKAAIDRLDDTSIVVRVGGDLSKLPPWLGGTAQVNVAVGGGAPAAGLFGARAAVDAPAGGGFGQVTITAPTAPTAARRLRPRWETQPRVYVDGREVARALSPAYRRAV